MIAEGFAFPGFNGKRKCHYNYPPLVLTRQKDRLESLPRSTTNEKPLSKIQIFQSSQHCFMVNAPLIFMKIKIREPRDWQSGEKKGTRRKSKLFFPHFHFTVVFFLLYFMFYSNLCWHSLSGGWFIMTGSVFIVKKIMLLLLLWHWGIRKYAVF